MRISFALFALSFLTLSYGASALSYSKASASDEVRGGERLEEIQVAQNECASGDTKQKQVSGWTGYFIEYYNCVNGNWVYAGYESTSGVIKRGGYVDTNARQPCPGTGVYAETCR